MRLFEALLAVTVLTTPAVTAAAPFCKTLKGEWVGIGEADTRKEADSRLDRELTHWGERYSIASVKPKGRKVSCALYLELLNEYLCTAQADVCR
jgi:hypothetical protein